MRTLRKTTKFGRDWLLESGAGWLSDKNIRPYVYLRKENQFKRPGQYLSNCNWFREKPLYVNPLEMKTVKFANQILNLESRAFQKSGMPMPRWVFYDCAVVPGFVCGFAQKTSSLNTSVIETLGVDQSEEWTPLSLFIIIPTLRQGEWVAHNLCTLNSLVVEKDRLYALGYLSKAFGIWYANVETLCGMTQWDSPALRLHSHYGHFEILTAYTPVHSYAQTLTYRSRIQFSHWPRFFMEDKEQKSLERRRSQPVAKVNRKSAGSMMALQAKIEKGLGPFYLHPAEIRERPLDSSLNVYKKI